MLPPDLALALLIDRTSTAYTTNAPAYMTYVERTHVVAPTLGRSQEIDREVAVRVADDTAVMHDLPRGATRIGEAFPIIPYFDPLGSFSFSYFANLKRIDITLQRGAPMVFPIPSPQPDIDVTVAYASFWDPRYAPDSAPGHLHVLIAPTPRTSGFYPAEIVEDPQTRLPARIVLKDTGNDMTIALDYRVIEGHWVIVHGTFSATEHAALLSFPIVAEVTYDRIAFASEPPDPRLAPATAVPAPTTPAPPRRHGPAPRSRRLRP
jgi:hypothetical protein